MPDIALLFLQVWQVLLHNFDFLLRKIYEESTNFRVLDLQFQLLRLIPVPGGQVPEQTLRSNVAYYAGTACPEKHHGTLRLLILHIPT